LVEDNLGELAFGRATTGLRPNTLATFIAAVFVFVATRLFRVFTFVCFLVLAIKQAPEQQSLHGWSSAFCSKTAGFYAIQNLCYNYVCNILS
jgi:hypothetical protein